MLDLHYCASLLLVVESGGWLLVVVSGLLISVASLVAEHGLSVLQLCSCSSWALEHRLNSCSTLGSVALQHVAAPRSGIEPVSPALAGKFFTTEPPGKPPNSNFCLNT